MQDGSRPAKLLNTRSKPHHRAPKLLGLRFGRLLVDSYAGSDGRKSYWKVRCDCGVEKLVAGAELTKGSTQSCGCKAREGSAGTHRMSYHSAHIAWRNMIARCHKPNSQAFKNYGARGILVCERWHSFQNFWMDMGSTWRKGLTLERLDNSKGYSPENCAWRDHKAQARNTRANRTIDTPAGTMLLCEAADLSKINLTTLCYRLGAGWPTARLFDPPDLGRRVLYSTY